MSEVAKLQSKIDEWLHQPYTFKILEAGCGSSSHLHLPKNTSIVGIDISEKQLQRNGVLDEKILGDIQTYPLPALTYDVIVCWDVLEHLPSPRKALKNFINSIKNGGIIILASPNVLSVKGLLTKYTPHWFHIWTYRYIFGRKNAGKDDNPPFPTYMSFAISPSAIKKLAQQYGLSIEYCRLYENPMQKEFFKKRKLLGALYFFFGNMLSILSLGKISMRLTDFIMVLKK